VATLLTTGTPLRPDTAPDFPARRLTTRLAWDDLVLGAEVVDQIGQIAAWLEHERTILEGWDLGRTLAPGYRALFYGPPGTGKTLTAALLGQQAGLDVYRIDLSMVVSKYIGETEKNLAGVFDRAARQRWILFFDEADALFGARSSGRRRTTATPTRRSPTCCSGSRIARLSSSLPPTCAATSTTPSCAASSRSWASPARTRRSASGSGAAGSRACRSTATWTSPHSRGITTSSAERSST
jgi:SpoVK/Ycf46/Vps4 family AAA+-type ATPase